MEKSSVEKLLKAGYVFLREEDSTNSKSGIKYIIKYSDSFGVWKKLEEYPSKAARKRGMEELLNQQKYLFLY